MEMEKCNNDNCLYMRYLKNIPLSKLRNMIDNNQINCYCFKYYVNIDYLINNRRKEEDKND